MTKIASKFKFIPPAIIFALAILLLPATALAVVDPNLTVVFNPNPLFSQVNFAPGQTTTGSIQVTNNSAQTQKAQIEAIKQSNEGGLAEQFNFVVKQDGNILYEKTLKEFFDAGQVYLSDVASDATVKYDLSVTFKSEAGNDLQGKTVGFDLVAGFLGQEGITPPSNSGSYSGGGGGGSGLPQGLVIYEDQINVHVTGQTTATISWSTSYNSTSQVVYASDAEFPAVTFVVNPPGFGYPHHTADDLTKVTLHTVFLTGLIPDTNYHFRVISHASPPTVSYEHTFTTWPVGLAASNPAVAGAETAVPSGQIGEGVSTTRNLLATTGGNGGQAELPPGAVLGTATASPAGLAALANEVCGKSFRWDFGYLVYILLLLIGLAFYKKLSFKNYSSGAAVAAVAALLWWYLEPACAARPWPVAILAAFGLAVWLAWLLAKKSAPTPPTSPTS